jgi:phospholipid-transporting ATPase
MSAVLQVFIPDQGCFGTRTWKDVCVGDIIIVHKNHYIPADLLFLSAENEEGICYIETMQLDGETNLKIKKALDETKDMREETIGQFVGTVHCEPPNSRLYQFTGNLDLEPPLVLSPTKLAVTPSAVLLRGCSLRNTNRVFGMVLYAGECAGQGCCMQRRFMLECQNTACQVA